MRSERCWARTHRFAVLPTFLVGLALIGLDVTDANPGWPVIGGLMAAWAGGLTLYSYVQWRNDPVR